MAVIEIQAKTLLAHIRQPEPVFGLKFNMNLYRGCQHQCIYCDSRSECYGIENFHDIQVKVNAIELLERALSKKRVKGTIGTGSMHDPYMPIEKQYQLTRQALERIAHYGFGVHVNTKSDLIVRDVNLLKQVSRVHATVGFSISMIDDDLSAQLEPGAPNISARFAAMRVLAEQGINVGVCLMPVLPFIQDTCENITAIIHRAVECGARFIVPWFGMSLRDRQRDYYYAQLDRLFPGLRLQYERAFGTRYSCPARNAQKLAQHFYALCAQHQLHTSVPGFKGRKEEQLTLF